MAESPTNDNQRKAVLGFLEVELAFAGAPKDIKAIGGNLQAASAC